MPLLKVEIACKSEFKVTLSAFTPAYLNIGVKVENPVKPVPAIEIVDAAKSEVSETTVSRDDDVW
jgi:hypothetical protein